MSTAQNPVAVALFTKLTGHAALTALLSGGTAGVFERIAPESQACPYVVFQVQSPSTPRYVANGGTAWEDVLYTVKGVTEGWSLAPGGTIADKIDDALNAGSITVTGYTNVHLHRVQDVDYIETPDGKRYNHRGAIFQVRVAPA